MSIEPNEGVYSNFGSCLFSLSAHTVVESVDCAFMVLSSYRNLRTSRRMKPISTVPLDEPPFQTTLGFFCNFSRLNGNIVIGHGAVVSANRLNPEDFKSAVVKILDVFLHCRVEIVF